MMHSIIMMAALFAAAARADPSSYVIRFPAVAATSGQITKETLDTMTQTVCTTLSTSGVTCGESSLVATTGTYTISVEEPLSGAFGQALEQGLSAQATLKCAITSVSLGETSYFEPAEDCYTVYEYNITYKAAAGVGKATLDGMAQSVCAGMFTQAGVKAFFNESVLDDTAGLYTVKIKEIQAGFGTALSNYLTTSDYKCVFTNVTLGGEQLYEVPEACVPTTETDYKITFPSQGTGIEQDTLDNMVNQLCTTIGCEKIDSELDNGVYTAKLREPITNAFGEALNAKITPDETYNCLFRVVRMEDGSEKEVHERPDECFVLSNYSFGLSMNKPAKATQNWIDNILTSYVKVEGFSFVTSDFADSLYTATFKELNMAKGSVASTACSMISMAATTDSTFCHLTFIEYNNTKQCTPRTDKTCAKIDPGQSTNYDVKYTGNMNEEELNAFFDSACAFARSVTYEHFRFISGSLEKKNYKLSIYEPRTGMFAESFYQYDNNSTHRCDFEYMKVDKNDYLPRKEVCGAAFGFAPLAFLMFFIVALLF